MTMRISPGTSLGRYKIRSQLGAGGLGEVYLARDTKLDRNVALKVLPGAVISDEQRMRRFVQEAKAASALNHPNIITIYEIEQIDATHFIATEFIDGQTLRWHLSVGRMKIAEVLDISAQTDFKTDRIFWFDWSRDGKQLAFVRGAVSSDVVQISEVK